MINQKGLARRIKILHGELMKAKRRMEKAGIKMIHANDEFIAARREVEALEGCLMEFNDEISSLQSKLQGERP
jgi:chromosome segregation ATPase